MVNSSDGTRKKEFATAVLKRLFGTFTAWRKVAPALANDGRLPWTKPAMGVVVLLPPGSVIGSF
jgi:hypothetical protein